MKQCSTEAAFKEQPVKAGITLAARTYLVIRRAMEMHRRSDSKTEAFNVKKFSVQGFVDESEVRRLATRKHEGKSFQCSTHYVPLPVTFLNSMLMLNLHLVDSIDDPVQVAVRKNLLAYSGSGGIEDSPLHDLDYLRSVLRGVKRTCPTGNETVQH